MMNISRLIASAAIGLCALTAAAVPAKRGLFPVTQPDGSVLMIQRAGDERIHLTMTADGRLVTEENGAYYIARMTTDGLIESTGELATSRDSRAGEAADPAEALRTLAAARQSAAASAPRRSIAQSGMGRFTGNFPRTGKVRGLVILAQYKDVKFTHPDPVSYFTNMLMQEGFSEYGGTGSAHDYFIENSGGQFDPQFDVYGPVTLPQNRSYYGANDYTDNDQRPAQMISDACKALDSEINFADYDMDNDGYVDNVFVFYAGQGEASYGPEDSIWPHQWELTSGGIRLTLDGKKIDKYACTNEWELSSPDGVGTFIHEFSHVMGLPDLYDNKVETTPQEWSVLDYGPYNNNGRTPPNYSIFERNAMGWCEPQLLDGPSTIELEHIATSNHGCIIPTTKDTEFFLIENRQLSGWDKYLPHHGLLIWHIDFVQSVWDNNSVNSNASHQYVEIEPANNLKSISTGWSWPGSSRKTSFTSTTSPAMKSWAGKAIDLPITDITEKNGKVTFNVAGGEEKVPAPVALAPTSITTTGFTAAWQPVDGATDYLLTVSTIEKGSATTTETYDGQTLPKGWTCSFTDVYTSKGNYGDAAPSLKFSKTGHSVTTAAYTTDITGLSFWHKGQSVDGISYLLIEGLVKNMWTTLAQVYPTNNKSATYTLTDMPQGVRQLRLSYSKKNGNMAVDDITVTLKGGDMEVVLAGYDGKSTSGATSHDVDLAGIAGETFTYYVCATDGESVSRPSNSVSVNLRDAAGIEDVSADDTSAPVEYFNLQGVRVDNPAAGGLYIRRQGNTVVKVIIR